MPFSFYLTLLISHKYLTIVKNEIYRLFISVLFHLLLKGKQNVPGVKIRGGSNIFITKGEYGHTLDIYRQIYEFLQFLLLAPSVLCSSGRNYHSYDVWFDWKKEFTLKNKLYGSLSYMPTPAGNQRYDYLILKIKAKKAV